MSKFITPGKYILAGVLYSFLYHEKVDINPHNHNSICV